MNVKLEPATLTERYEQALLAGDEAVVQECEQAFAAAEVEARRTSALQRAEERQVAEAALLAEQEAKAADQARRAEARTQLDIAEATLRKQAAAFAKSAAEVLRLAVEASNVSAHPEVAQVIRAAVAAHVPEPFQRRLLSELGRPQHFGGGSIA